MSKVTRVAAAGVALALAATAPGPAFALANVASVFCVRHGGRVEFVRDATGGQRGICVLPNGTRVDEWVYYRAHHHMN